MSVQYLDEAGSFEGNVIKPEAGWFGETKEKQTPFIRVPIFVTDAGPNAGKLAIWTGWLTDKAIDNTIARLAEVFRFNGDLSALHTGAATLEGLLCNITTEIEEYEGKKRCKVAWLNPPGGGAPKAMDENKVKALLARITPKAKALAKSVIPAAPTAPAAATPEPVEDDVPF